MIFILKLKKPIIHVLSEVMKRKTVDSYCFIIQNATIFMFYSVLNTIKINLKTLGLFQSRSAFARFCFKQRLRLIVSR